MDKKENLLNNTASNMRLSQQQLDHLEETFLMDSFSFENEVNKLVEAGFDRLQAEKLIAEAAKTYRQKIFQQRFNKQRNDERRQGGLLVVFMVSLIGPVFDISSPLWYIVALLIVGAAGYFAYQDKPFAGISASTVFVIAFPFMYNFYFSGRSSYINIELVIPLLFAIIPAFLVLLIISKLFYADNDF